MRPRAVLLAVFLLALALPAPAAARVDVAGLTSPVRPGAYASLTVAVAPPRACSISVLYKRGPSKAAGLGTKRPIGGKVTWRWRVGTNTTPGRWAIAVDCGASGKLRTSFVVRR